VVITFAPASPSRPVGGATAIYEFANGMRRRGHEVHLVHRHLVFNRVKAPEDITWCEFEAGIHHHFPGSFDVTRLPDADFTFHYNERLPDRSGAPLMFVQGAILGLGQQEARMLSPCPKICIASWLVEVGRQAGVPEAQLVHVPYGLKHHKYRLLSPVDDRPPQVSMLYHRHPSKGAAQGFKALAEVKEKVPELQAVVFGASDPVDPIPPWMSYLKSPDQDVLVGEVYNRSRVFLCSSVVEGFGFSCIEAMACGAALVTTSNGGSDDYAIDGETALVCEADDVTAMASRVESLLRDDEQRTRLATLGGEYVRKTFDWDASAEKLETFLNAYAADPDRYRRHSDHEPAPSDRRRRAKSGRFRTRTRT
jgi:glycosyltransferase involved in cell wall biosynthesis